MPRKTLAVLLFPAVLAACVARGPASELARARARGLGLSAREREAFAREVTACVRREQARAEQERRPATPSTLAVGVRGEAAGDSAGGLAAVGVMATAITAGIAYRWWKGIGHRAARGAEPGAAAANTAQPAADAVRPDTPVAVADTAAIEGEPAASTGIVDACLATVTARWSAAVPPGRAVPPSPGRAEAAE
jgi:hypothetical protein